MTLKTGEVVVYQPTWDTTLRYFIGVPKSSLAVHGVVLLTHDVTRKWVVQLHDSHLLWEFVTKGLELVRPLTDADRPDFQKALSAAYQHYRRTNIDPWQQVFDTAGRAAQYQVKIEPLPAVGSSGEWIKLLESIRTLTPPERMVKNTLPPYPERLSIIKPPAPKPADRSEILLGTPEPCVLHMPEDPDDPQPVVVNAPKC